MPSKLDSDLELIGVLLTVLVASVIVFSIMQLAIIPMFYISRVKNQASVIASEGLKLDKSSLDWGNITVGGYSIKNITVTNKLPVPVVLRYETQNWDPKNASSFVFLSWDYVNQTLASDESLLLILTLNVSPEVEGITTFYFDIVIYSEET